MDFATRYRQLRGISGAVVTGHPASTDIASSILRKGGSAADAVIAAAAALAVVRPHMCGLGADGFFMVYDAKARSVQALNAAGPAPAAAGLARFGKGMPEQGSCTSSVPGIVDGWGRLHERHGRLSWREIIEPSIELAERGFPMYRSYSQWIAKFQSRYAKDPGCAEVFLPGGRVPVAGEILRQPALARALRILAANGPRDFYEGEIARSITRFMKDSEGLVAADDLSRYQAEWLAPITSSFKGCTVHATPPVSQGWMLAQMTGALDGVDLAALGFGSKELTRTLIDIVRSAFNDRNDKFGDPKFVRFSLDDRLSQKRFEEIRRLAMQPLAEASVAAHGGDTTSLSVVDGDGNGVAMIQSLWLDSAAMTPDTGIVFNGRLTSCSIEPGHPNVVEGGKTPVHTMNTYVVTRDGALRMLGGTPGGHSQVQTNFQVITNVIGFGMEPQAAVEAPRFLVGGAMEANTLAQVFIEGRIPKETEDLLAARGDKVFRMPDWAMDWVEGLSLGTVGSQKMIAIDPETGVRSIGVDPRRDAHGITW